MARRPKEPPGQEKKNPPPQEPPPEISPEITMKEVLDMVISHMRGNTLTEQQKQIVRQTVRKFSRIHEMIEKMDKVLDTDYEEKQKPSNRKPKRHRKEE